MTRPVSVSEQLTHCTVRIVCQTLSGEESVGTGFFFKFLEEGDAEDTHLPVIITNKHVIEGAQWGDFYLNIADENGAQIHGARERFRLGEFEAGWIKHPDPGVDLCFLPLGNVMRLFYQAQRKRIYFMALGKEIIPTAEQLEGLAALEDIVMVGYPIGLWDKVNNMPIIRRGITATHPKLPYNGREEFMIDAACFPGSSGSPVVLYNETGYIDRNLSRFVPEPRVYLLGVLYAGPQFTATGEIEIVDVPTQKRPIAFSDIPMNLGYVIKSRRIVELEDIMRELMKNASPADPVPWGST
jgi:hypothetical protein